jgi:hypothetical protein
MQNQLNKQELKQPIGRRVKETLAYSERRHSSQKEKYLHTFDLFVIFFPRLQTLR